MKKLLILFLLFASPAVAHDWYPYSCCSSQDCQPVPCEELSENKSGSWNYGTYNFTPAQVKPSQDKNCHVCIHEYTQFGGSQKMPMCVFIQQGS
jgi:hypothetical protein